MFLYLSFQNSSQCLFSALKSCDWLNNVMGIFSIIPSSGHPALQDTTPIINIINTFQEDIGPFHFHQTFSCWVRCSIELDWIIYKSSMVPLVFLCAILWVIPSDENLEQKIVKNPEYIWLNKGYVLKCFAVFLYTLY